jgi:hypothetical protein
MSVAIPASLAIGASGHEQSEPSVDIVQAIVLGSLLAGLAVAENSGMLARRRWARPHRQREKLAIQQAAEGKDQACILLAETHGPDGCALREDC